MKESRNRDQQLIDVNRLLHDKVASDYDRIHVEIFNPTEQRRIGAALNQAFSLITSGGHMKKTLDFGAGTGNLTGHLLDFDTTVTAADLSQGCLNQLEIKLGGTARLQTLLLNGEDLSDVADNTFDMVVTYSVLHHIPDYLKIIAEFARVVRSGGVIYIDHEVTPSYWDEDDNYNAYLGELGGKFLDDHLFEIGMLKPRDNKGLSAMLSRLKGLFDLLGKRKNNTVGSEINDYGDIHVFRHDHIEWEKIREILVSSCEIAAEEDYLVCRERSENPIVWNKWQGRCADMRLMIAQKRLP